MLTDWYGLATLHPERVASLILPSPPILDAAEFGSLTSRLLVVAGDQGISSQGATKLLADLPSAASHILSGYDWQPWSDVISDRGQEIGAAMLGFLGRRPAPELRLSEGGEVAGITYRIRGAARLSS